MPAAIHQSRPRESGKAMGHAPAGLFGYSQLTGHYLGGQAEYLGGTYAEVSPLKIGKESVNDSRWYL